MSHYHDIDTEALKAQLWAKLDTLPQRDAIELSDAKQWIDYMANIMPREAMWHMTRAGGVGGSEIGGLVRNYLGQRADHDFSAHKWALGKLLREVPDMPKGVTERGHFMEPIHAARFYEEFRTARDQAAYDKLSAAQGSMQWMRYSPDDVVFLNSPTTFLTPDGPIGLQGRILVDYKSPTVVDYDAKISFQYVCQLHQGALLCQEQGIDLGGTLLSQFDWAKWEIKNDFVEINPELCELIPVAGQHFWDYVLRAEIPESVLRQRAHVEPKTREEWEDAAIRLGQINAMKTKLDNAAEALKTKLVKGLGLHNTRLDGQQIQFPGSISISSMAKIDEDKVRAALGEDGVTALQVKQTSVKYDEDALVARLKALGENVKPYRKLTKLDPGLTFEALAQAGFDPEDYIKETPVVRVDSGMKVQAQDWFDMSFPPLDLPEPAVEDYDLNFVHEPAQEAAPERAAERQRT